MFTRTRNVGSFFRTQLRTVIFINVLSLSLVAGLLYSSFVDDYKDNLVNVTRSKASLIASASRSAILFHDKEAATEVLSSLQDHQATRFAQIFDADNQLFATFRRQGETIDVRRTDLGDGSSFIQNNLYVLQDILMDDERIGSILISADTRSLDEQRLRYALTVSVVLFFSLFIAYILNWRMQSLLTAPLRELVNLIGYVAKNGAYDRRLQVTKNDEIGALSHGVNSMLDTIQAHERQLKDYSHRLESMVKELFDRAHYDALTNLPNRHLLTDRLSHAIEASKRTNKPAALLFLDLDRFKVINDSLGHPLGDRVLIAVAKRLKTVVRKSDSISRWGGDEFILLLENVEGEEIVQAIAKNIIQELMTPFVIDGHQLHVSTCIGIATYPKDGEDPVTLLKHADISMYKAKGLGPGHYCFFKKEMLADSMLRLTTEINVRQAVEQDELFLVYQPQVRTVDGHIDGMEALSRWEHNGELISPEVFIPVIEELGLMRQFCLWVLRQTCQQNRQWQIDGLDIVRIAVNLPASFIIHPQCVTDIKSVLDETGLDVKYLEVEITENTFMSSTSHAVEVLSALAAMGIRIAIDDFGTGYSCMSYLRDLPITSLKIDGSFVEGLGHSQANDGIVQSIITLGHSLDLVLIAECVETEAQLEALRAMNCDVIQGYYFSKPLEASAAATYISASRVFWPIMG